MRMHNGPQESTCESKMAATKAERVRMNISAIVHRRIGALSDNSAIRSYSVKVLFQFDWRKKETKKRIWAFFWVCLASLSSC